MLHIAIFMFKSKKDYTPTKRPRGVNRRKEMIAADRQKDRSETENSIARGVKERHAKTRYNKLQGTINAWRTKIILIQEDKE